MDVLIVLLVVFLLVVAINAPKYWRNDHENEWRKDRRTADGESGGRFGGGADGGGYDSGGGDLNGGDFGGGGLGGGDFGGGAAGGGGGDG